MQDRIVKLQSNPTITPTSPVQFVAATHDRVLYGKLKCIFEPFDIRVHIAKKENIILLD